MLDLIERPVERCENVDDLAHILPITPAERLKAYYADVEVVAYCGAVVKIRVGVPGEICLECSVLCDGRVV